LTIEPNLLIYRTIRNDDDGIKRRISDGADIGK